MQELRKQRKRPNRYDEVSLFFGLLFCADCGSVLYQQRYQTEKRKQDCYICGSYKKRTSTCTAHFIRTDLLKAGVTANIRKVTGYAEKHKKQFMKLLIEQNEDAASAGTMPAARSWKRQKSGSANCLPFSKGSMRIV